MLLIAPLPQGGYQGLLRQGQEGREEPQAFDGIAQALRRLVDLLPRDGPQFVELRYAGVSISMRRPRHVADRAEEMAKELEEVAAALAPPDLGAAQAGLGDRPSTGAPGA